MNYQSLDTKRPLTLLLKGVAGTGKTTKAAYFPAPVIFNFDNNITGLRKLPKEVRDQVKIVNPRTNDKGETLKPENVWDNFVRQLEQVLIDPTIKTVILDSLTTLSEIILDKALGTGSPTKRIELQHWGDLNRYLKWLGDFLLCAQDLDKHVIFIAHEQMEKDELTQSIIWTLNLGGKLRTSYDLYFSDCWRCTTKQGNAGTEFWVRVMPGSNFSAKCSLTLPDQFKWEDQLKNIQEQLKLP